MCLAEIVLDGVDTLSYDGQDMGTIPALRILCIENPPIR